MTDCKLRTGMILGALIVGGLVTVPGCGAKPASNAPQSAPTVSTTTPEGQAKLQATIQKAQAQGAARQALMAAHPHVPVRPTGN